MIRWGAVAAAAVAAALMVYGSVSGDYWRLGGSDGFPVGLGDLTEAPGFFGLLCLVLRYVGPAAALAAIVGVVLVDVKHESRVLYGAGWAGAFVVLGGLLAWLTFPGRDFGLSVTPGIGALTAWVGGAIAAFLGIRRPTEPVATTPMGERPRPSDPLVSNPAPGLRPGSIATPEPTAPRPQYRSTRKAPNQRMGDVGPSAADAARRTLRFVASACQITDTGFEVTTDKAEHRAIAWSDIARVVARRMPPDPPFEKVLFVDLVPASGDPIRLLPTTKVNYSAMPGSTMSSKENLRRLGAFIRERNPAVDWNESAGFFENNQAPIAFLALRHFADYDSRYG